MIDVLMRHDDAFEVGEFMPACAQADDQRLPGGDDDCCHDRRVDDAAHVLALAEGPVAFGAHARFSACATSS